MITVFLIALFSSLAADVTLAHLPIPITLEHAVTEDELAYGLMNRKELAPDHGMTFNFPTKRILSSWMFNCYIDLSIAFLDEVKVIEEIQALKAYPEKMDPDREVRTLKDLYPPDDPITLFFLSKAVVSAKPAQYALEMGKGWFAEHGVKARDVVLWDVHSPKGLILKTLNLDPLLGTEPLKIIFNPPVEVSLAASKKRTVTFFNEAGNSIEGALIPDKPLYTKFKVSYALINN